MSYFFTSESVSEGHPDKIADQISDAILDNFLAFDPDSKVALESMVTTGQVVLAGEVRSKIYVDLQKVTRETINNIGYNKGEYRFTGDSCGIMSCVHEQSEEINRGVDKEDKESQGAGDQGIMFGYAINETESYMPLALEIAHSLLYELAQIRKEGETMTYLRPDSKAQVTLEYDYEHKPIRVDTIVLSTQHDAFANEDSMRDKIKTDIKNILIPRVLSNYDHDIRKLFQANPKYYINPTGSFVIGGPHGDTGLTGRKIIVDTYGGKGAHGGGAFSGKDPSKVDRSAAYAMRHLAKNLVAAGVSDEVQVQISYAIGMEEPTSLHVNTLGTSKLDLTDAQISEKIRQNFKFSPYEIEKAFDLRKPIYLETAAYGHMGRTPVVVNKKFTNTEGETIDFEVELFSWEKLDKVEEIKALFSIESVIKS